MGTSKKGDAEKHKQKPSTIKEIQRDELMVDLFYSIRITLDIKDYAENSNEKMGTPKKRAQKSVR